MNNKIFILLIVCISISTFGVIKLQAQYDPGSMVITSITSTPVNTVNTAEVNSLLENNGVVTSWATVSTAVDGSDLDVAVNGEKTMNCQQAVCNSSIWTINYTDSENINRTTQACQIDCSCSNMNTGFRADPSACETGGVGDPGPGGDPIENMTIVENAYCGDFVSNFPASGSMCATGQYLTAPIIFNYLNGPWFWTCYGVNGGHDASCVAGGPEDGVCGTADGKVYPNDVFSYGTDTQCSGGFPSSPLFPSAVGSSVSWTCDGIRGSNTSDTCSASKSGPEVTPVCTNTTPGTNQLVGCAYGDTSLSSAIGNAPSGAVISGSTDNVLVLPYYNVETNGISGRTSNVSARWKGTFNFTGGNYAFTWGSDDGFRVYLDDNNDNSPDGGTYFISRWYDQAYPGTLNSVVAAISAGQHTIAVEYYQGGGGAAYSLAWQKVVAPGVCNGSGSIKRDYWTNIGTGNYVTDLTTNTNYPNNPTGVTFPTSFEGPTDWAETYGTRMYGYLHAAETGSYTFYIASDDYSELWLSTNDNPVNKVRIAYINAWTPSRAWSWYPSQTSSPINLVAGQRYYIEALHKEGAGGDNLAVGYKTPSNATITVIPGACLSPYPSPDLTAGSITSSPATVVVNTLTTFSTIITNSGTAPTGNSFPNRFQISSSADGSNPSTISVNNLGALAAGVNNNNTVTSSLYTFTTAGTYYVKVCADQNASGVGSIAESNESNNCSTGGLGGNGWNPIPVGSAPQISVNLTANPLTMTLPTNSTLLTWSTTGSPTSCTASESWSGSKTTNGGTETRSGLTQGTYTYTITCSKAGQQDQTASRVVTVNAVAQNKDLTVNKSGQGDVTSTSVPTQASQISCGSGCQSQMVSFTSGAVVTVTADSAPGRIFTGWNGCDSSTKNSDGSGGNCTVTMDSPKSVIANFVIDANYREF